MATEKTQAQTKTTEKKSRKLPILLRFILIVLPLATVVLHALYYLGGYAALYVSCLVCSSCMIIFFLVSLFLLSKKKSRAVLIASIVISIICGVIVIGLIAVCDDGDYYVIFNQTSSSDSDYSSGGNNGAGGYEMPNENDDSFADYVQRVDPDLYEEMQNNYYDAIY